MSVDSTEELKRQIEAAQSSEFDDWLKGFEDDDAFEAKIKGKPREPSIQSVSGAGHSEEWSAGFDDAKFYALAEKADIDHEPWKYLPAAELNHRKQILTSLDHQLEYQVKRRKDAHEKFEKRWDKTVKKQDMLVVALAKFSVLYSDCKDKRALCRKIQQEHEAETKVYEDRIVNQKKDLRNMIRLLHSLENRISIYQPIREFLQDVRDMSEGRLPTVAKVIDRAVLLENIRLRLIVTEWENHKDRRFALRERFGLSYRELKNMLRLSNERTRLSIQKVLMEKEVEALEDHLESLKTKIRDQDVLASRLKLSVNNLYAQLCKALRIAPQIPDTKPMKQLQSIGLLMGQLQKLRDDIYKKATVASDVIDLDADTCATEKKKLRLKLGLK